MKPTKLVLASVILSSIYSVGCSQGNVTDTQSVSNQDVQSSKVKSFDQQFQAKLEAQGIPAEVAQVITSQATSSVNSNSVLGLAGLLSPNTIGSIAPMFLQGALGSVSNGSLSGLIGNPAQLVQPIMSSFTSSLTGNLGGLNASQLSNLFTNLGSTQVSILPVLGQSGLPIDQIIQSLGMGFTTGLGTSGASSNLMQIALSQLPMGLASGIPALGQVNGTNWMSLLQSFSSGSFAGIPSLGSQGLDLSMISQLLTSGTSQGLVQAGIGATDLSKVLSMIQLGGLSGLTNQTGLDLSQISTILQGSGLGSLAGLSGSGFQAGDIANLARLIPINTIPGLSGLGFNGTEIGTLIGSLTQGMVGSTGQLGLNLNDIGSILSQLNLGGISGINLAGLQGNDLSAALAMLSQGSISGLSLNSNLSQADIASLSKFGIMGSVQGLGLLSLFGGGQGLNIQSLIQSISAGAMSGLGQTGMSLPFLQTGASNIALGSFLGMLFSGFKMENITANLMPAVNQGAQTGLVQGGFQGNILQLLLSAVLNVTKDPAKAAE